jgi:hypothetical protein
MTHPPTEQARGDTKRYLALAKVGPGSLSRHPEDGWQLAAPYPLGARALAVLRALIAAICPATKGPHSPELQARVERSARVFLSYMHPIVARGLALGILLLDVLPILSFVRVRPLRRLARADASALLAKWAKSRLTVLRLLVMGVRSLVLSVYFDQSEVHAGMGYAPVPFIRDRMRLRRDLMKPRFPIAAE